MRKILSTFILALLFTSAISQGKDSVLPKLVDDKTLIATCGYKIVVGENISIGVGSKPDGDFKFIRRNSTGFATIPAVNNGYQAGPAIMAKIAKKYLRDALEKAVADY